MVLTAGLGIAFLQTASLYIVSLPLQMFSMQLDQVNLCVLAEYM